ncbi:MMPL family transporter [Arthrobacter sp. BL-252-APC-1A]|uniref:MMPL family transporter n=1 Tax=Arthrobacter sp. BL-252-APC-1A TaxID=2606622 RepID=UPI0012B19D20|nr:MMPL family transporter [Arthrobacter sp. BL-252-APC-1A]MSR97873.1 MMPL family transporter [Arthrobacter sp. BL-252-APC-1A]
MASLLYRLGKFSFRHRWWFLSSWLVLLLGIGGAFAAFSAPTSNNFTIPGSESQRVLDEMRERVPDVSGGSGRIVFETESGEAFTEAERQAVIDTVAELNGLDFLKSVSDPFEMQAQLDGSGEQLAAGQAELDAARAQLEAGKPQLDAAAAQLAAGREQLSLAELQAGQLEAAGQTQQAEAMRAQLQAQEQQLQAGEAQLAEQQEAYDDGLAQLAAGEQELKDAERKAEASSGLRFVSEDGVTAFSEVQFQEQAYSVTPEQRQEVQDTANQITDSGVKVFYSKEIVEDVSSLFGPSEAIGVAVAAVVLILMLGTLVAAGLPLLMALVGVIAGVGTTMALTGVVEMTSISPMLALMLGLAVGIDYSLFIINRHRTQLLHGMELEESAGVATGTSGNAVLFAGLTVVIALAALAVPGLPFLSVMGLAAAGTVAMAILVALTLTPAFLGFIGNRILSKKAWAKAGITPPAAHAALSPQDRAAAVEHRENGNPRRWGRLVTNHPVITVILSVLLLGTMAIPAGSLRVGLPDGGSEPEDSTAYQAYQLLGESFGEGINGPVIVVGYLPDGVSESEASDMTYQVADSLRGLDNVTTVVPASTSEDGTMVVFQVIPEGGPAAEGTEDLVHTIRDDAAQIKADTGVEVAITGQTGINIDVSDKLMDAMPIYLLIVVGLSLVLLLLVFRSVLVPLIATGGFLLSLAASFGAVVAIYQWGWLGSIFDVHNPGAVLSFLPIILIGVLFGLAMDYQMFLVSGMREAYVHGEDPRQAVRSGFDHASRVVTAAAIIMVSVFAGFIFAHLTMVRPIGFALAIGVLLDAFVIRMTLIPAVLHLLGKSAWWIPKWLDRILPDVDVEGAKLLNRTTAADRDDAEPELASAGR